MNNLHYILGVVFLAILFSFLVSYPLMLLWNGCLVPAVTVLEEVTWLQMWGIVFLLNSLFNSKYTVEKK